MKLSELWQLVDYEMHHNDDADKSEVVIDIQNEYSLGARPSIGVKFASTGIDWEANQFRITPSEPIAKLGHAKTDPMPIRHIIYNYSGGNKTHVYKCPICEEHLKIRFKYCPICGQRVMFDKTRVDRFENVR